jgi:hypothetical protein
MTKKKDKKRNIYIELKIEQHHIHWKPGGVKLGDSEG